LPFSRRRLIMLGKIIMGILIALLLPTLSPAGTTADKQKKAVIAAEKWLSMVDAGSYAASWQESANYFRTAVSLEQWEQSLNSVRKPLGRLITRKVKGTKYMTSLPGAPDGEYVVIRFATSFEKKKTAVETVTPMLDSDGKWRVSGYYIK
jgi:hypothetical protein